MSSVSVDQQNVANQKKIQVLNMKLRQIWPKYAKDQTNVVFEKANVVKIIQTSFTEAMLKSDFDELVK
jgi:hypothetical protein